MGCPSRGVICAGKALPSGYSRRGQPLRDLVVGDLAKISVPPADGPEIPPRVRGTSRPGTRSCHPHQGHQPSRFRRTSGYGFMGRREIGWSGRRRRASGRAEAFREGIAAAPRERVAPVGNIPAFVARRRSICARRKATDAKRIVERGSILASFLDRTAAARRSEGIDGSTAGIIPGNRGKVGGHWCRPPHREAITDERQAWITSSSSREFAGWRKNPGTVRRAANQKPRRVESVGRPASSPPPPQSPTG